MSVTGSRGPGAPFYAPTKYGTIAKQRLCCKFCSTCSCLICPNVLLHALFCCPYFADSIKDVAVNTTLKLMHFLNTTHIPLAVSTLQPKNAFPFTYRALPLAADVLPLLNPPDLQLDSLRSRVVSRQTGQDALLELLLQQKEPVTVIATGVSLLSAKPGRSTST